MQALLHNKNEIGLGHYGGTEWIHYREERTGSEPNEQPSFLKFEEIISSFLAFRATIGIHPFFKT